MAKDPNENAPQAPANEVIEKPAHSEPASAAPEGAAVVNMSGSEFRDRSSKIDRMRDLFAKQKKVAVRLPEDTRVQINGFTFLIKGKATVEVPESVLEVLEQAGLY